MSSVTRGQVSFVITGLSTSSAPTYAKCNETKDKREDASFAEIKNSVKVEIKKGGTY